jgi:hypothetical protein
MPGDRSSCLDEVVDGPGDLKKIRDSVEEGARNERKGSSLTGKVFGDQMKVLGDEEKRPGERGKRRGDGQRGPVDRSRGPDDRERGPDDDGRGLGSRQKVPGLVGQGPELRLSARPRHERTGRRWVSAHRRRKGAGPGPK